MESDEWRLSEGSPSRPHSWHSDTRTSTELDQDDFGQHRGDRDNTEDASEPGHNSTPLGTLRGLQDNSLALLAGEDDLSDLPSGPQPSVMPIASMFTAPGSVSPARNHSISSPRRMTHISPNKHSFTSSSPRRSRNPSPTKLPGRTPPRPPPTASPSKLPPPSNWGASVDMTASTPSIAPERTSDRTSPQIPATYSSLPPSPRGEYESNAALRGMDLTDLQTVFARLGDSPLQHRRRSLCSASESETEGSVEITMERQRSITVSEREYVDSGSYSDRESEVERERELRSIERGLDSDTEQDQQFWPARSRRPTLEGPRYSDDADMFWPAQSRRATMESAERPKPVNVGLEELPEVNEGDGDLDGSGGGSVGGRSQSIKDDNGVDSPMPQSPLAQSEYPPNLPQTAKSTEGMSLWDLLRDEEAADQWEGWIADGKWERIANFLAVPLAVEKVTLFGALLCLDGFLYNFTILPIRATFAASRIVSRLARGQDIYPIPPAHVQSLLRMLLIILPAIALAIGTDASKMYHSVRGQDTIKLYVIFNALEIADRLCCAFGQDVLDTLFARDTLTYTAKRRKREHVRPTFFFFLSLGYVFVHTLIFTYMLIALNVAINSYDYTLISLLISNQFVEIKGSVFKKFEKENLFQIMCADIVERFQLALMLLVIAVRNMIEMAGSDLAFLPRSFVRGKSLMERILSPVLFVLASECLVDWLKHAFIAKFNHVRASVYGRFMDVLAKDVLHSGTIGRGRNQKRKHPILLDQSPLVARRLGIAAMPLAALVVRIGGQVVGMLASSAHADEDIQPDRMWQVLKWAAALLVAVSAWGCLVALKILLGLGLLSFSALRQAGMPEREAEDAVNDFGRAPVGVSKEELDYHKDTTAYLSRPEDDLADHGAPRARVATPTREGVTGLDSTPRPPGREEGVKKEKAGKKKSFKLEEVERWTMVKRIW